QVRGPVDSKRMKPFPAWHPLLIAASAAMAIGCARHPAEPAAEKPTRSLPDAPAFELADLGGKVWTNADLSKGTYLVEYWATWCVPCEELQPTLERLAQRYKGNGLRILAVTEEAKTDVQAHVANFPTTYPILVDAGGRVTKAWGVGRLPTTFLVRTGKVLGKWEGAIDGESIESAVQGLYGG
ncbi:MAG TPA: TlpA disulfide reductase family protein, partial [Fimbriimonas sp.]